MNLGDRIKRYEKVTRNHLIRRVPVIIRVDGRAFHTFTKKLIKPFDYHLISSMVRSAILTSEEIQGFKAAYVQSDEVTFLLTDYDNLETDGWFGYNLSKIVSISAALMSVNFTKVFETDRTIVFDSRAFNVPIDDVANVFLWRAKDWERNSLQMYCRHFFSHKQLLGKNHETMHNMLHEIGRNWSTDLTNQEKNGTFIFNYGAGLEVREDIIPNYENINAMISPLIKVLE